MLLCAMVLLLYLCMLSDPGSYGGSRVVERCPTWSTPPRRSTQQFCPKLLADVVTCDRIAQALPLYLDVKAYLGSLGGLVHLDKQANWVV